MVIYNRTVGENTSWHLSAWRHARGGKEGLREGATELLVCLPVHCSTVKFNGT